MAEQEDPAFVRKLAGNVIPPIEHLQLTSSD
jgi:hypothetical protein